MSGVYLPTTAVMRARLSSGSRTGASMGGSDSRFANSFAT